ncbi:Ig domain-containing protein [Aurantimicrobium minutum]|uniref:Ig domain-containing protein n=1 Tax=Aurantimicrobium minutum TaxID=708131 RepID=UPI00247474EE|nr:Ig domain-containing protein [Aurantimicrobium minutum]MDH6255846.1 hypothetical protein [Aurantimicrobium minutum]
MSALRVPIKFRMPVALVASVALLASIFSPLGFNFFGESAQAAPQTFVYTGAPQLYVVPEGITSISVEVRGAQGGNAGNSNGGRGATVTATIAVTPGESIQINVGGSGNHGGWNGGGRGVAYGGGASDIRRPAFSTSSSCAFDLNCSATARILVAGGGGGGTSFTAGGSEYIADGADAGLLGGDGSFLNWNAGGSVRPTGDFTRGGLGGTASAGGLPGNGTLINGQGPSAGSLAQGGESGYGQGGIAGGGGGGGYFGGGAGGQSSNGDSPPVPNGIASGGAGSSYYGGAGVSLGAVTGTSTGDGTVTVSVASAIGNAAVGFTGGRQFYTVPATITEMYVKLYGAQGGNPGDVVWGRLPVTSGQVLQINVGGRGWGINADPGFTNYAGGWNGGGNSSTGGYTDAGQGGGGATDIRVCANPQSSPCALTDRVVVAGGGGGGYVGGWGLSGGNGGGLSNGSGSNAAAPSGQPNVPRGGSLIAGGLGSDGSNFNAAGDGALGVGGSVWSTGGGGGGGGGYYGGGAGLGFGGAGGSSFASVSGPSGSSVLGNAGAAFTHSLGGAFGDGLVVIAAMPQAVTTNAHVTSYTAATITGTVNPRYLASTPKVFYGTNQTAVAQNTSSSTSITGPSSAAVLAGTSIQSVSGGLTGLSAGTTYFYTVCAQSVAGYSCGAVQSFATPANGAPLWVDEDSSRAFTVGGIFAPYTYLATGTGSMTYSVSSGALPTGVTLDPATGVLSGSPTVSGTYNFVVSATNSVGTSVSIQNSIVVTAAVVPPTPPTPAAPASLPHTGFNPDGTINFALLSLGAGALLLAMSALSRRRKNL